MAARVFQCPVAPAFAFPHVGYKFSDLSSQPVSNLFTLELDKNHFRGSMLPREAVLPDSRKFNLQVHLPPG